MVRTAARQTAAATRLPPLLVVAIVGGTNIGKSVIFNHLAGEVASAVQPAGRRHEASGVPRAARTWTIRRCSSGCSSRSSCSAWQSADDPLGDTPENRLFWRIGRDDAAAAAAAGRARRRFRRDGELAARPGDSPGGRRAGGRADAAEIQRRGGEAVLPRGGRGRQADRRRVQPVRAGGRPRLLAAVAGDVLRARPARGRSWSTWFPTIARRPRSCGCRSTTSGPTAPRRWASRPTCATSWPRCTSTRSRFAPSAGRWRRVLDPQHGVPAYLESIRTAAGEFSARGRGALGHRDGPGRLAHRCRPACWSTKSAAGGTPRGSTGRGEIHGFYRALGRGVTWPVRPPGRPLAGPRRDPLAAFQQQERAAIVLAVEKLLDELDRLAQVGNDTLRPRLLRTAGRPRPGGTARPRRRRPTSSLPAVDDDYRAFLRAELDAWRTANPRAVRFLQSLDHVAAVARPAITVALFFTRLALGRRSGRPGGRPARTRPATWPPRRPSPAASPAAARPSSAPPAKASARPPAGCSAASNPATPSNAPRWLADWLERELLGDLLADLRRGAEVPQAEAFREVEAVAERLRGR